MFFRRMWERLNPEDTAERWRREHSRWLTAALAASSTENTTSARTFPRIPTARISHERAGTDGQLREESGFTPLMRTPEGRAWAERWWDDAFECLEE